MNWSNPRWETYAHLKQKSTLVYLLHFNLKHLKYIILFICMFTEDKIIFHSSLIFATLQCTVVNTFSWVSFQHNRFK